VNVYEHVVVHKYIHMCLALSHPHFNVRVIVDNKNVHVWQLWIMQFDVYTLRRFEEVWLTMWMG